MKAEKNGIYIHLPFCLKKCNYCDFTSYADRYGETDRYIDALVREMSWYEGAAADTVYLGGGTPSSLPIEAIARLTEALRRCFSLDSDSEISMEVNPKTAELSYFQTLRSLGFNRLSIGLQSLSDAELSTLGRLHTAAEGVECVRLAQEAGFDNVGVDLMYGLPDQSFESFLDTLERTVALDVQHVSCYGLSIERGTAFQRLYQSGKLNLPDEETERCMYEAAVELLTQHGFGMYEISNFARPGFQCRHNVKYWRRRPYIGLGAAAASLVDETRFDNPKSLDDYFRMVADGRKSRPVTVLTDRDRRNEFLFLGLRMNEGVDKAEFKRLFRKDLDELYGQTIRFYTNLNLMRESGGRLRLTLKGMNVSNAIFARMYE